MAAVDILATQGRTYTLDALNEWTPWFDPGDQPGIALITLEFNGSWNGTVSFEATAQSDGAFVAADPVTATNLNGASTATTSVGGASAVEHWRVDLAGGVAVRVQITTLVAGAVDVTIRMTRG